MNFGVNSRWGIYLISSIFLTACTAIDKTPQASIEYAPTRQYANESSTAIMLEKDWWKSFESAQLTDLIDAAQQKNSDVLIALERVKQAELQMQIANASLFPFLSLTATSGEKKLRTDNDWLGSDSTTATLSANYEIDLWGGIAASRHAAKSNYKANVFATEATRLSISAGVATAWFTYLALQERIKTARQNSVIAERIQKIVDSLYRHGAATAGNVAQQKTNLLTQQAALLPLHLQLDQTRSAIALLEGQAPQGFQLAVENFNDVKIPNIHAGVPAVLITRRPDVASAEAQLQAASADVHIARTALLPSVQLGGSVGKSAAELFALSPAIQTTAWSITLAQTLFAGGRVKNGMRLSESRRVELLENYRKTILVALQEVDDALNRRAITRQQENNQHEIVMQAELSLTLAEIGYREGASDLQTVLDSQRSFFQAQDALVQLRLARMKAAVDLYKALGGGWRKYE